MPHTLDVLNAFAASAVRLGAGVSVSRRIAQAAHRPTRLPAPWLALYDFEACPYCRLAREALTMLDLDAVIYPCPRGGTVYRPRAPTNSGPPRFPVLVDGNAGQTIHGSAPIVDYLFATYGAGKPPRRLRWAAVAVPTSALASALRLNRGGRARPSRQPQQQLELYSFEASPHSRIVRETLCELELAYVLRNVGKGAPMDLLLPTLRVRMAPDAPPSTDNHHAEGTGKMMVPYLVDPNTGVEMFESAAIRRYLLDTYAE